MDNRTAVSKNYHDHLDALKDKNLRMFVEREELTPRTAMSTENYLFALIRNGDVDGIDKLVDRSLILAGTMSNNSLRQAQYMAVAFIALGTRVVIEGGMLETDALSMSDYFIQEIDRQTTCEEIFCMIFDMMKVLAISVKKARLNHSYSIPVRRSIDYIFKNLHGRISLEMLATHVNLSREHLSRCFKKETGKTIAVYILEERLSLSCSLLSSGMGSKDIAHTLAFSSQSHYISKFGQRYGVSPARYVDGIGSKITL